MVKIVFKFSCPHFVKEFGRCLGYFSGKSSGVFSEGGSCDSRFVLKPDVAIASEVSISSKNSLAKTDFLAGKTRLVNHCETPLPGTPPFAIPKLSGMALLWSALMGFFKRGFCNLALGGVGERGWEGLGRGWGGGWGGVGAWLFTLQQPPFEKKTVNVL